MTSAEHNDLMPTKKLEWVTPKISIMNADNTMGSRKALNQGEYTSRYNQANNGIGFGVS